MSTERNLKALQDVMDAYRRLEARGLTSGDPDARGLNADGFSMMADLLAVGTFQTGTAGTSDAEQAFSNTARACLSALGGLYAEIGDRHGPEHVEELREHLQAALNSLP